MSAIEAAAMWTEANVSIRAARVIISHLRSKFKNRVQVPFSQIQVLSSVTNKLRPVFDEFVYRRKEKSCVGRKKEKIGEKIQFWTYNVTDLVLLDFERLLQVEFPHIDSPFGYDIDDGNGGCKQGVLVSIGSDHGGGKSRFIVRVNYLGSQSRREVGKSEFGSRFLQFAEVSCKKDVWEVHSKISPEINRAIKLFESSKLMAIKTATKILKCILLPLDATDVLTFVEDCKYNLKYTTNNILTTIPLGIPASANPVTLQLVVPSFHCVVSGDLSYFATCTGRDGHSHCRCPYCDSTPSMWNDQSSKSNLLTLSSLKRYASIHQSSTKKQDTKGVIMPPLLHLDPSRYIIPILHLLIGLVNKEWQIMLSFFDDFVENVSEEEIGLKIKRDSIQEELSLLEEDLDVLTVNKNMACVEVEDQAEALDIYNDSQSQLSVLKLKKGELNSSLKEVKVRLKELRSERIDEVEGLDNLLHQVLEESSIKKQSFHGGAMNGVCCRRLLDNSDVIFRKIKSIVLERFELRKRANYEQDLELLTDKLDQYKALFETTDVVFSYLRILNPTDEEKVKTKDAIRVLESMWRKMEIWYTPKAHILFDHASNQVEMYGGIADLAEDHLERSHQDGKRLDHLVARMSSQGFVQQELAKIRRQWLGSDPAVHNQLQTVKSNRKRVFHLPSRLHTKKEANSLSKRIKREASHDLYIRDAK